MSESAPKPIAVSVLMPVYNAEKYVGASIRSIIGQTFADLELVVIDDGSTDGSLAIIQELARSDGRIRVVSRANCGVVATRNELLHLASAELVAVLDADDIAVSNRLQLQWRYMADHPDCVAVGSKMRFIDPTGLAICERFNLTSHEQIDAWNIAGTGGSAIGHSSVMMRKKQVIEAGGYREGFEGGAEDYDLWLRLGEAGKLANLPEVLVLYRLHDQSFSRTKSAALARSSGRAVSEARARRNLPTSGTPIEPKVEWNAQDSLEGLNSWFNMAMADGNRRAAAVLAMRALRRKPFSRRAWRMGARAMIGRAGPANRMDSNKDGR